MSNVLSKISGTVKNWWVFLIIGILLLISSFWMFSSPIEAFVGLAGLFSALIFVSGLFTVFFALTNKDDIDNFGLYLAGGVLDIIMGFILMKYPGLTVVLFSLFVGFWLLFRGIGTLSIAFKIKKEGDSNWGWILFFGILVTVFAFMAIVNPLIGASYLVYTLALALLFLGIANIYLALRLRKVKKGVSGVAESIKEGIKDLKEDL
jgi:uncharacterized membrane protein HdeD (DUF308 family)